MSKYLEGMSEYDKGFVDGNRAKEALQAELKAQIEREARIEGLMMARYVTAKNSKEEKAIDILIKAELKEMGNEMALGCSNPTIRKERSDG